MEIFFVVRSSGSLPLLFIYLLFNAGKSIHQRCVGAIGNSAWKWKLEMVKLLYTCIIEQKSHL